MKEFVTINEIYIRNIEILIDFGGDRYGGMDRGVLFRFRDLFMFRGRDYFFSFRDFGRGSVSDRMSRGLVRDF